MLYRATNDLPPHEHVYVACIYVYDERFSYYTPLDTSQDWRALRRKHIGANMRYMTAYEYMLLPMLPVKERKNMLVLFP